jgi:hypothetical protein
MSRSLALLLRRFVVRTEGGPLGRLWALLYEACVRGVARYVRAADPESSAYARGSLAARRALVGHSDVDVAVVVEDHPERPGDRRRRLARRWERLCRFVPALGDAVDMAVYERTELREAAAAPSLLAGGAVHLGDVAADEAGLRVRPGLGGPRLDWRLLAGPDRLPAARERSDQERRIAAWLELQFLWRCAFTACVGPGAPYVPYLCVKFVADPVRVWLWLVHGELVSDRRAVLVRALRLMPEEEPALREALALHGSLASAPRAPLERMLPALVRLSARLAARIGAEVEDAGTTGVRLVWRPEEPLALPAGAGDRMAALAGRPARLLPLADWRARAWPLLPDDALAPVDLDPGDPGQVGRASAAAGDYGPYAALRADGLLVLPGPGIFRAVQCEPTDPVSFALVEGRPAARYPDVAGRSAADCARRAVEEHRGWLGAQARPGRAALPLWMEAQARTTAPELPTLGRLLTAAQAALFLESVEEGDPRLPVTMAATARLFDERHGGDAAAVAYAAYAAGRRRGHEPPLGPVARLRRALLALPAYRFDAPRPARAVAGGRAA